VNMCLLDWMDDLLDINGLSMWLGFAKNKDCQCRQYGDCGEGYTAQQMCHWLEGNPAWISGDPHTMTFAGVRHDFQGIPQNGKDQYYYIYPCSLYDNIDLPFNMIITHEEANIKVSGMDYITLELFMDDGNIDADYYVYLAPEIAAYASTETQATTYYDDTRTQRNLVQLVSGQTTSIGKKDYFQIEVTKSVSGLKPVINVKLIIDGDCAVEIYMMAQGRYIDGRYKMNYMRVNPPECYKCEICGLFGDFQSKRMQTCDGNVVAYGGYLNAWDETAWTWEYNYVNKNCKNRRERPPNGEEYVPPTPPPEIVNANPCDEGIQSAVTAACNTAIDEKLTCCASIGGSFCDDLKKDCYFDACVGAEGDLTKINEQVTALVTNPITEECKDGGMNIVEENFEVVETPDPKQDIICPKADGIWSECNMGNDPRGINEILGQKKSEEWMLVNYVDNKMYSDWPLVCKLDGPIYGFRENSQVSHFTLEVEAKCKKSERALRSPPAGIDSPRSGGNGGIDNNNQVCDAFYVISFDKTRYISISVVNDQIALYPACGEAVATGNPAEFLSETTSNDDKLRDLLAGGSVDNWAINGFETQNDLVPPLKFEFVNNAVDGTLTVKFKDSTTSQCVYNGAVPTLSDIKIYVTPDWSIDQVMLIKYFAINGAEMTKKSEGAGAYAEFEADFEKLFIDDEQETYFGQKLLNQIGGYLGIKEEEWQNSQTIMTMTGISALILFIVFQAIKSCKRAKGKEYKLIPSKDMDETSKSYQTFW